jgi:hypothetical protein
MQLARPLKAGASVGFEQARERARFEFDVFVPVPARTRPSRAARGASWSQ